MGEGVFFVLILLLVCDIFVGSLVYEVEVFGLVSILMFYDDFDEVLVLVVCGCGSLVVSLVICSLLVVVCVIFVVVVWYGCLLVFDCEVVLEFIGYGLFLL